MTPVQAPHSGIINSNQTIIFIHIPKAAGTTLKHVIRRQYRPRYIFPVSELHQGKSIHDLNALPDSRKEKIKLIMGHLEFGLHTLLPQPSLYLTMLRHPIDRVISHYYYVLRTPKHYLYQQVVTQQMSLEDYVCSGITTELDNGQARFLTRTCSSLAFGQCDSALLEQAKKNLQAYFPIVGIAERFDETLLLMQRQFGWKNLYYEKKNVSLKHPAREDLPSHTLKKIEEFNALDMQLYEYANQQLDQALQHHVNFLSGQLLRFKVANRIYNLSGGGLFGKR